MKIENESNLTSSLYDAKKVIHIAPTFNIVFQKPKGGFLFHAITVNYILKYREYAICCVYILH